MAKKVFYQCCPCAMFLSLPKSNASNLISKYCYTDPKEIDLEQLAFAENLYVKYEELDNCEGKILFDENAGLITINSGIEEETRKRFTLAHEMGHFYNEKGKEQQFRIDKKIGYYSQNRLENDANIFAGELLMHEPWYKDFTDKKMFNYTLLSDTAQYFNVSLTAAVFRYSEIGHIPIALVYSVNGIKKWCTINKDFPYKFIELKNKISKLSYAYDYFNGGAIPEQEDVPATAWFKSFEPISEYERVMEMNIPMPSYNALLTVLWEN